MRTEQASRRRLAGPRRALDEALEGQLVTEPDKLNLQGVLGNGLVSSALSGAGDAFGDAVRGEAEAQRAGAAGLLLPSRESSGGVSRPDEVGSQLERSTGAALPGAVARRLSAFLGHDVTHARVHTDAAAAEATSALHAKAFALGADVFFAPGQFRPGTQTGDQLLVHELTHVRQFDAGRIAPATGLEVSSPSDALEIEARDTARGFQNDAPNAGDRGGAGRRRARAALPAGGVAHRDVAPGTATEAPTAPSALTLGLGGWTFQVTVPGAATPGASLNVTPPSSGIAGLSIRSLRVDVGPTFQVRGGQLTGSVTLGSYVTAPEVLLRVGAGGAIDGNVRGARLAVGQLANGTVDLVLSSGGISGAGVLAASQLSLAHGFTTAGGGVQVAVAPSGAVTGSGSVSGAVPGVGPFQLAAQLRDTELVGSLTVDFASPIPFGGGVSLRSGHLAGAYGAERVAIRGIVALDVGGWARGDVSGAWATDTRRWNAAGTLNQVGSHAIGELNLSAAVLQGAVVEGDVQPFAVTAHYGSTRGLEGELTGAYDPVGNQFDGTGTAAVTRPWALGAVTVTGGDGAITVIANALVRYEGSATVEVPWQGEKTFLVTLPGVGLDLAAGGTPVLSGSGSATTTRDLVFGESPRITVPAGAQLDGTLAENALTAASGDVAFRVADGVGEFGAGNAALTFDPATGTVNGSATFALTARYGFPDRASERSYFAPGGTVTATITEGRLARAEIALPFAVQDPSGAGRIEGSLVGSLVFAGAVVEGTGTGAFTTPWPVPVEFGTFQFVPGGSLTATVAASSLSEVTGDLPFETEITGDPTLSFDGRVAGSLDVAARTADGSATLTLTEEAPFTLHNGDALVGAAGSTATAAVTANGISSIAILLQALYRSARLGDLATGTLDGAVKLPSGLFTGQGDLTLGQDLPLAAASTGGEKPEQWAAFLDAGASVRTSVVDDVPERAPIAAAGHLDRLGGTVATATLSGEYLLGDTVTGFTGRAAADVVQRFDWFEGGRFAYAVDVGTHLDATVDASRVTEASGTVRLAILEAGEDKAFATFAANYAPGAPLSGVGTAEVVGDLLLATRGENTLFLAAGSAGSATVADDQLATVDGTLKLRLDEGGAPLLGGDFSASWAATGADAAVNGAGTATLLRRVDLGASGAYHCFAEPGSGLVATLTDSAISEVTGTVHATVEDGEGAFLRLTGAGRYSFQDPKALDFTGSADVAREKKLGESGRFAVWIVPGTGATAVVEENALTSLAGTISARVEVDGAPFATVALDGTWSPDAGFSGSGAADLVVPEWQAGEMGRYTLWLVAGGGTRIDLAASAITRLSAQLPIAIREGGADFLTGNVEGEYLFASRMASGSGSLTVAEDKQLPTGGSSEQFWLLAGSGANVTIAANDIARIGGDVHLAMRDAGGQYLDIQFQGSYDTGEGVFDGGGGATITREKRLPTPTSPFALAPGAGANATIEANVVTSVTGAIPFFVYTDGVKLLRGQVNGDWQASTNVINGSGEVFLASDQTFGPIRIKEGSGGTGEVVNSELTRFTGTILAVLSDAEGELVDLSAQGEFDARANSIVRAEGGATMLRDWEPISGLVISGVTGRGLLEDNEIREVDGAGTIAMEAIHATGTFDAHWRNAGGADTYWGAGALDFDWAMGSASGRGITGAGVAATLHEDQTFEATGTLQYAINDQMKGDLAVTVDQTWDPELAGSFDSTGTLIDGKELFKKEMQLIPHQMIPVFPGIGIGFGMMGSMGLNLRPLTYTFGAAISGFHPLHADVPDFEASLGVQGGLDFFGALAPYLGVAFGIPGLNATAGVKGQVALNAPVNLGIEGTIFGRGGSFGGELGVSAGVEPTLSLSVIPFARVDALGMGTEWEFGTHPIASMSLFSVSWGTTYHFGDSGPSTGAGGPGVGPTQPSASAATFPAASASAPPSLGTGTATAPSTGREGLPQVGGADVDQSSGTGSGLDGILNSVGKIAAVAEGVTAAQRLVGRGLVPFDPAAMAVKIITEWDGIEADVQAVVNAIAVAAAWLTDLLPDWFWTIKRTIDDGIDVFQDAFHLVYEAGEWIADGVSELLPWNW